MLRANHDEVIYVELNIRDEWIFLVRLNALSVLTDVHVDRLILQHLLLLLCFDSISFALRQISLLHS